MCGLTVLITLEAVLNFFVSGSILLLQVNVLLRIMPRNLVCKILEINLSL